MDVTTTVQLSGFDKPAGELSTAFAHSGNIPLPFEKSAAGEPAYTHVHHTARQTLSLLFDDTSQDSSPLGSDLYGLEPPLNLRSQSSPPLIQPLFSSSYTNPLTLQTPSVVYDESESHSYTQTEHSPHQQVRRLAEQFLDSIHDE